MGSTSKLWVVAMATLKEKKGKLPCGRPLPDWRESHHSTQEKRLLRLKNALNAYVSKNQLNQSTARTQVLEIVVQFESHFTATDLIERISKTHPKIGAATVYRSLQSFLSAEIIRETFSKDSGEKVYEVESTEHHDHIVCLDCDAILEFHESKIEVLQEKVLHALGFKEARHRHVIYAHCEFKKSYSKGM